MYGPLDVFNGHTPEIIPEILPEHNITTDGTISGYHRVDKIRQNEIVWSRAVVQEIQLQGDDSPIFLSDHCSSPDTNG